jgi:hypothetical protein
MLIAFELSMPNIGSWNGKWTGEDRPYVRVKNVTKKSRAEEILKEESFYYNFGDGWGASVRVRSVDKNEARKLRKKTAGFSGYDWMITSIIDHNEIRNSLGRTSG